jgi:hypothetical protein
LRIRGISAAFQSSCDGDELKYRPKDTALALAVELVW